MTTEGNPVDEAQREIDQVQEGTVDGSPEVDWKAQFEALTKQMADQGRQVSGLTSKIDKGLDAIRRDSEERIAKLETNRTLESTLAGMPEEYRSWAEPLVRQNAEMAARLQTLEASQSHSTGETQVGGSDMQQIYDVVRDMGLDPNTPGIDYGVLAQPGLSDSDRRQRFFASIRQVQGVTTPTPAPPQPTPPPQPQPQTPPTGRSPSAVGNVDTIDSLLDQRIRGEIDNEQFITRARALGEMNFG